MQDSFSEKVLELTDLLAEQFSHETEVLRIDVAEITKRIKTMLKVLLFRMNQRKIAVDDGITIDQIWAQIADYNQELLSDDLLREEAKSTEEQDNEEEEEDSVDREMLEEEEEIGEDEDVDEEGMREKDEEGDQNEGDQELEGQGSEQEESEEEDELERSNEFEEEENSEQERQLDLDDFSQDDDPEEDESQIEEDLKYANMYKSKKQIKEEEKREAEVFEEARRAESGYLNEEMVNEIEQIEARMIRGKDWQLKGEISAKERPVNSLLAEHLDFAVVARSVPSSQEVKQRNDSIEEMIKRRVKEGLFDDPIHKFAGITPQELERDGKSDIKFQKAEKGLGEEYASLLQKQALGGDPMESQHIEKVHQEIDQLQTHLFSILDQMSQTHYVRIQKHKPEIKAEKIAALQIEEKVPIAVSLEKRQLAGELLDPKKGVALIGNIERERGTQHKQKKRVIRAKIKAKKSEEKAARRMFEGAALAKFEARLKYEQEKHQKKGEGEKKEVKQGRLKSVQFFKSMENIAKDDIAKKRSKKEEETTKSTSSKRFKL